MTATIKQFEKALNSSQGKSLSSLTTMAGRRTTSFLPAEFQAAARTLNSRKNSQLNRLKVVETSETPWF